ncbi:MAG TPA: polysaccharide lyase family protein [Pirellulales bacterium]|nr:polysaccharide lyase family protein [Pirellulales bacterium]
MCTIFFFGGALGLIQVSHAAITRTVSGNNWIISNGALTATFSTTGSDITSLVVAGHSDNILDPSNSKLYPEFAGTPFGSGTMTANFQQTSNYIDFWTTTQSNLTLNSSGNPTNPITYSFHYVMFNNDPAIHMYEEVSHASTDPATSIGQGQFLMRVDPTKFSTLYQFNTGPNNPGATVTNLPTTTAQLAELNGSSTGYGNANRLDLAEVLDLNGDADLEQLIGRNFLNKYDYSSYTQFWQGQTEVGPNYAVSTVLPSKETMTGGPTKQNLMFTNNILMVEFLSGHYGDSNYSYVPPQGVDSSRLFGPYVFRVTPTNGETPAQLYQDAINSASSYIPLYDTDSTLLANGYVSSTQRGSLQISLGNSAGWSNNVNNNTLVLSDPNTNFQESHQGYQYWAQVNSNGTASISGIAPGTYRMSIYEYGQWGETRVDGVQVKANLITIPQNVKFTPENFGTAAPIWTLGTPNRSANEFLNGHTATGADNRNYYGSYNYWQEMADLGNNGKVVYYATAVGSTPATNDPNKWIANQWGLFNPALYNPADNSKDLYPTLVPAYVTAGGGPSMYTGSPWEIHFTTTSAQLNQGQYVVLSVGLAANEASLIVTLNGHTEIWHFGGSNSDPMVRSGVAGVYKFLAFQYPTSDLNAAGTDNEFTFGVSQNDGVMYDAMRMEITNTSANPSATGWFDYDYITGSNTQTASGDSTGLSAPLVFVVPEPTSLALLAIGSMIFLSRSIKRKP